MTIAQRKNTKTDIDSIDRALNLLVWKKDVFIRESSEKEYEKAIGYVKSIMSKLEDKCEKLPIGHRYTGTFYLRKPYTIPYESIKIKGAAFLREDLVSWTIESDDEYAKNLGCFRSVYKEKAMKTTLERDDGEAVFDAKKKIT